MSTRGDRPAELVRALHLELWGDGDMTAIDRYISPAASTVMTGFDGSTIDVLREDVERYSGRVHRRRDRDRRPDRRRRQGGAVVADRRHPRRPVRRHRPEPTGERITMEGVDIFTRRRRSVVEVRSFWDAAEVYRQFGLLADGL